MYLILGSSITATKGGVRSPQYGGAVHISAQPARPRCHQVLDDTRPCACSNGGSTCAQRRCRTRRHLWSTPPTPGIRPSPLHDGDTTSSSLPLNVRTLYHTIVQRPDSVFDPSPKELNGIELWRGLRKEHANMSPLLEHLLQV